MTKRPNMVIFNPDQYRADFVHHLGNPAAVTPHFDQIIQHDAVSFRHAYCQNPICTPSRCSFMSGWYPHVRGHRTIFHLMQEDEPVLLRTLKEHGYFVWWGGKNDLIPGQNSYEPYCDVLYRPERELRPNLHQDQSWRGAENSDDYYSFYAGKLDTGDEGVYYDSDWAHVDGAIEWIEHAPSDKPFCLYLPLQYPHPPYGVEDPWYSMIDREAVPERIPTPESWEDKPSMLKGLYERQGLQHWTEDRWTELRATYLGMCARIDHQFGMIVEALKKAGLYENTAIFVFSDHGDFTGDYGLVEKNANTFQECLTRVPFIIKPPSDIPVQPGIRDALVELIDFPATVEAMVGIKPKHTHFGRSLLPLIRGETERHRDAVFCEGGRLQGETHCMEKESVQNTLPSGLYWPKVSLQSQEGPEHTKAIMCRTARYKYVKRFYEKDELYDLQTDPQELHNRIEDPNLSAVLLELKERLLDFYMETADVVPHQADERFFRV